jgi:outer membrane immunogenic protein
MGKRALVSTAVAALAIGGISASAFAADLPIRRPVYKAPPLAPVYNWTSFYVGAHLGWAWTDKNWRLPSGVDLVSYTADDVIGGVQGGYNWQTGAWVLGVEVQASWGEIRQGVPYIEQDNIVGPAGRVIRARVGTTVENLGTLAVRIGHAWDRSLVYVKGGAAWAYDVYRAFDLGVPGPPLLASGTDTRWGGMVGVGYEYAFLGNWSAKIEYDYLAFGDKRITLVSVPGVTPTTRQFDVRQDISLIKVGINYRFGGPLFARY